MNQPADTFAEINREMQELTRLFTAFRNELSGGRHIDLAGMDSRVKQFCDRVENADVEIRKQLLPDFTTLLALLEVLETELRAARDRAK